MNAPTSSAFFSRLRETDHPFQGWLPAGTLAMGSTAVANPANGASETEEHPVSSEPASSWEGAGEVPFVFLFASEDSLPSRTASVSSAERELWEKMIAALGFAPARARLGTLSLWSASRVAGVVAVAVGVSMQEARAAGVVHVIPSLADLVRDASLKRPAWKTLQEAAASVAWSIAAARGSR